MWESWLEIAFICRFGNQDVHRLRGIDRPLTPLERSLFARAIYEHVRAEFEPKDEKKPEARE